MSLSRAVAHRKGEPDCRRLAQKHPTTYATPRHKWQRRARVSVAADDSARQFQLLSGGEFTQQLLDAQQTFITVDNNV